jgi:putative spermidine/putrescine transport system ATP-binding protein
MSLTVENLSHTYSQGKSVLDDFSLELSDGECVAVVGRSGCGKTTLLHCIAGLISPSKGVVCIDGEDVSSLKPHERGIGIMMQDQPLYEHLTVEENIAFPLRARGEKTTEVGEIIKKLQLEEVTTQKIAKCSGGERRRVAFGRAIVLQPSVILLDEPFVSLNDKLREMIRNFISEIDTSTILVTHDVSEVELIAERIIRCDSHEKSPLNPKIQG